MVAAGTSVLCVSTCCRLTYICLKLVAYFLSAGRGGTSRTLAITRSNFSQLPRLARLLIANYRRVGRLLELMKSRARRSLREAA